MFNFFSGISQKSGLIAGVLLISLAVWSQERLILIGGGPGRPDAALKQYSDWAGQENGNILVIAWASEAPSEAAADIITDFAEHFRGEFSVAMTSPKNANEQYEFLLKLRQASGVFFTGGKQRLIMETFLVPGGSTIRSALVEAYQSGVVFGGTSAGTAVMSRNMIVGSMQDNGFVPIDFGLGFLPPHIIIDQHFSQRERETRLLRAQNQTGTKLGIGIDEDTAIIVKNRSEVRVEGAHHVRIFLGADGLYVETTLKAGDTWIIPNP